LAVENIKTAAPDGQSLLVTPDVMMVLYPHVFKTLAYDPVKDFRAVTTLATVPVAFAVGPVVPAGVKTLTDFAKWCKANPQSASFGTSGAGSVTSLHWRDVCAGLELRLTHVPYRGANLAAQDTAAGQIASCVGVLTDLLPLAQAGKMRLLGISTPVAVALRAGRADVSRSRLQGNRIHHLVRPVRSRTHARRSGEGIAWRDGDGVSATRSGGDPRQVRVRSR